jgi:trehalose utilization protein
MTDVTVWCEDCHDRYPDAADDAYPDGLHAAIADGLRRHGYDPATATLAEPEHGLTEAVVADTDVLVWWGHEAHDEVEDAVVDRVCGAVRDGMGLVVLHSAHHSKVFRRLMGTSCDLTWRESGDRERNLNVSYMSRNDVPLTDPERTAEAVTEIAADAAGARIRAVSRRSRSPARVCAAAPSAP